MEGNVEVNVQRKTADQLLSEALLRMRSEELLADEAEQPNEE